LNIYFNDSRMINIGVRYAYGITNLLIDSKRGPQYGEKWKRNTITLSLALFFGQN
jgi:hypothetical protein